jgi:hypothetical protein
MTRGLEGLSTVPMNFLDIAPIGAIIGAIGEKLSMGHLIGGVLVPGFFRF